MSHRKYDPATGASKSSQASVFDPLDRTVSESTTVDTGAAKTTTFGYVGLTDQVINMYNGALADLKLGADPWNTNRYAFAGGNPITGIEFDGHISVEDSYSGGKYGAALELCPDCHVELNPTGGDPLVVGADSKDSVNEAVDNIFVGMLSGAIKTLETAAQGPLAPAYHLSGAKTAGSQFDELAAEHGADTDSVAYVAGEIVGIPIPAGVGARTAGGGARLAGGTR